MRAETFAGPIGVAAGAPQLETALAQRTFRPGLLPQPITFSTAALAVDKQFNAWRDECSSVIEMIAPTGPRVGYAAKYEMRKLGPFAFSSVVAPAAMYRRSKAQIRRDSIDHWVVSVARRGTHGMRTAAGLTTAPAGLPYIFSLGQAFEGQRSDIDWLCLFVPREVFPEFGPVLDRCLNQPLGSSMGQLLGTYLDSLEARLPTVTEAELPRLVEATRAVLAACVAPTAPAAFAAEVHMEQARLERVRRVIRQNLRSTMLTPHRLCRLVGMSRSQLYRLFEPIGGVARYIQAERLREAHRALSDPQGTRDVCRIAEDLGFFDPSTFSRAFRREFSCTPSEVRMRALSGQSAAPILRSTASHGRSDFASKLREL